MQHHNGQPDGVVHLDSTLVVLDPPFGCSTEVAQFDSQREGPLRVAVLRGVLDDRCERSHVGPHGELRVLLQALVLVLGAPTALQRPVC
eukprot:COSAG01_NODE_140_length_24259_cov_41.225096_12_plen_89_part_00